MVTASVVLESVWFKLFKSKYALNSNNLLDFLSYLANLLNDIMIWIILGVVVIALIAVVSVYNSLVRKRNGVDNAAASIDVMLKRRFDLVPNLVATVDRYASHEKGTLSELTRLRSQASDYNGLPASVRDAFNLAFDEAKVNLRAIAENYPDLKASSNFMHLQRSLNEIEEQLAASRRTYNACVTDYNNSLQTFPSNIIASMSGFQPRQLL